MLPVAETSSTLSAAAKTCNTGGLTNNMNLVMAAIGFGLVTASVLCIAAVGFTMQFGIANIFNLAYGDVMTAAAFVAYILNSRGVNVWACILVGGLFGAVASMLINRLVFGAFARRGTPLYGMVIVSLSTGLIIENTLLAAGGPYFFSLTFSEGPTLNAGGMVLTLSQIGIIAMAVATMTGIHLLLAYTRLGKAMRATADNAELARSSGIRTGRIVDGVWLISGALCGMAGVVLVINTVSFAASTGTSFLVVIIAAAILGGIGSPYGAILGALTIGLVMETSAVIISPEYKNLIAFVVLVFVLLLRPQGIVAILRAPVRAT